MGRKTGKKVMVIMFVAVMMMIMMVFVGTSGATSVLVGAETTASDTKDVFFEEHFDSLNTSIWDIGLRDGYAYVENGWLYMGADGPTDRNHMAELRTLNNPFPTSGNFELHIGMKYTKVTGWGDGLYTGYKPSEPLSIWQGTTTPIQITVIGDEETFQEFMFGTPNTQYHEYLFKYMDGVYYVSFDGNPIGTVQSNYRPTEIRLGHPYGRYPDPDPHWGGSFTSFAVDYIVVTPTPERYIYAKNLKNKELEKAALIKNEILPSTEEGYNDLIIEIHPLEPEGALIADFWWQIPHQSRDIWKPIECAVGEIKIGYEEDVSILTSQCSVLYCYPGEGKQHLVKDAKEEGNIELTRSVVKEVIGYLAGIPGVGIIIDGIVKWIKGSPIDISNSPQDQYLTDINEYDQYTRVWPSQDSKELEDESGIRYPNG